MRLSSMVLHCESCPQNCCDACSLPLLLAERHQAVGCWVDGGGSCMMDGDLCRGDEEAVPGGEASEHAARGGAAAERLPQAMAAE